MIIFPKVFPGGAYTFEGPDGAVYAKSDSGWVDSSLFLSWMKKSFLKFAVPERPLILFVDGHKSHVTLEVIDLAREKNVILFCLPPHTTHALQPLDVAVFKSLKDYFFKAVRAVCFAKKNFIVSKRDFARVVKQPFEHAFSILNIKAGFAKSRIFPFNLNAIDKSKMVSSPSSSSASSSSSEFQPAAQSSETETASLPSDMSPGPMPIVHASPSECSSFSFSDSQAETSAPLQETYHSSDSVGESSILAAASPSPVVSPWQSQNESETSGVVTSTPEARSTPPSFITNPLVAAGLIPANLSDILSTPEETTSTKQRRITGARVLTADEYHKMMEEKDRKEKEAAELKEKRKQEREEKKREREQKKAEKEQQKAKKVRHKTDKKGKEKEEGKPKKRKSKGSQKKESKHPRLYNDYTSDSDDAVVDSSQPRISQRPKRTRQLLARFCVDDDESSSDNDTLCELCDKHEPEGVTAKHIFWIDCDKCGCWVHTACAFGNNFTSKKYICGGCV